MIYVNVLVLLVSFVIMFKCADFFIRGASGIAELFNIPKLIAGIVLVGLATTAPEFGVSVIAAIMGHSEIALGNAIGSVIADDGIALALAGIVAPTAILVNCRILKRVGIFLIVIDFTAYFLARNGMISRWEGLFFIGILVLYFIVLARFRSFFGVEGDTPQPDIGDRSASRMNKLKKPLLLFLIGLIGVIVSSRFGVIWAALRIAEHFEVSQTIIGLTVIAIGTSLPEISTCITAALKGEGELAVGDILGADILNVLWIIGAAAVANPIQVEVDVINFTFPFMILVVVVMLVSLRVGCRLTKAKGFLLLFLYVLYFFLTIKFFM